VRLIALLLLLVAAPAADAATYKVSVRNPGSAVARGWTVEAGSHTLRPKGGVRAHATRVLALRVAGKPRSWSAAGRRCNRKGRRVACRLPARRYLFAPYVDMSLGEPPRLNASGAPATSLGFVTARSGNECDPTWGGYPEYPASGTGAYAVDEVSAYRGNAIPSFGGQAGTELAQVCTSDEQLAAAYEGVIDAYGATRVDFDIEGAEVTAGDGPLRARAIALLQREHPELAVSFTLPSTPTGLDEDALNVVRVAVDNGVRVSTVNAMAMDYGDPVGPGVMGRRARALADALPGQLAPLFPGADTKDLSGVTVMIGRNDDPGETLSRADAEGLAAHAASRHIGMLGMWALGRDRACKTSSASELDEACSGVSQQPYAFTRALGPFATR
jgi:chitinase